MTGAGPNVKEAAQKTLDSEAVDPYLAYLNEGLYDAGAGLQVPAHPDADADAAAHPDAERHVDRRADRGHLHEPGRCRR
ncbi:hypothetical protein ACLQ24_02105 [Micromonospora sp. DT4]|uniref:hypothetical protein n=1 Tax=Micromonospora sp. DT4 TaxID=3393438 RepID=UPI003CF132B5